MESKGDIHPSTRTATPQEGRPLRIGQSKHEPFGPLWLHGRRRIVRRTQLLVGSANGLGGLLDLGSCLSDLDKQNNLYFITA